MSGKIESITLKNFRSFYGEHTIKLNGKNMLIYGENGSGKSSIGKAIELVFKAASQNVQLEIDEEENIYVDDSQKKSVTIGLMTNLPQLSEVTLNYNGLTNTDDEKQVLKHNYPNCLFLDYKSILKLYLVDTENAPNHFNLLLEKILGYIINPRTGSKIKADLEFLQGDLSRRGLPKDKVQYIVKLVNEGIKEILLHLENNINHYLTEIFDLKFSVVIKYKQLNISGKSNKLINKKVNIVPIVANKEIGNYHLFFNEAKLSALALAIYFASLKLSNTSRELNLIVLDDIFIGMDSSNRLPLLRLLQQEFTATHQIIITTYDRPWFEIAKAHLENWEQLEIYVDNHTEEFPQSLPMGDVGKDYETKAWQYFKKKDYPACGNYQRKAFEEAIKALLPENLLLKTDKDGKIVYIDKLQELYDSLKQLLQANNFNEFDLEELGLRKFNLYKRVVLNPLSHDNLHSPVFKRELEETFNALKKLKKFKNILLFNTGKILRIEFKDNNKVSHKYKVKLDTNLRYLLKEGKLLKRLPATCYLYEYKKDDIKQILTIQPAFNDNGEVIQLTLQEQFQHICELHDVDYYKTVEVEKAYKVRGNKTISYYLPTQP